MENKLRVLFMVITMLSFLGCLAAMVWSLFIPSVLMCLTFLLLAALFGYFAYTDYVKMFKKIR